MKLHNQVLLDSRFNHLVVVLITTLLSVTKGQLCRKSEFLENLLTLYDSSSLFVPRTSCENASNQIPKLSWK